VERVSLAHPPTKPLSFIPSIVVDPSLIFRGQGRDVHPQLLVSQRQTQELRLDNQLRTSILLEAISMFTLTCRWMIRWIAWFNGCRLKVTEVIGAIPSKYHFLHLLKLSFIIAFDPQLASGQCLWMDKKERMSLFRTKFTLKSHKSPSHSLKSEKRKKT
uniref:Uncharacterized protein n=1 Tax=Dicentrarchus labrax TaxID=13489 RepID=A0A8C4FH22_DICLA